MTAQSIDIDRIRERQDAKAIDAKYTDEPIDNALRRRLVAKQHKAMRRVTMIAELKTMKQRLNNGSLSYMDAAGVLVTYIDDLLELAQSR